MRTTSLVFVVIGSLLAAPGASAQAPSLAGATPRAVRPGATTQVVLRGSNLAGPVSVEGGLMPGGPPASVAGDGADRVKWTVQVAPEQPVGSFAIRLATRNGVSNLLPVMVDDLPTVESATGNTSPAAAQAITVPVAVDGACEANASDYFRFAAKKGQRVSFEVVAARLGSQLDPVVRLLDAAGNELAAVDDTPGVGPDCRFAHTFAAGGDCVLEIHDANYAGGPDFHYRLRVGDFPLPTVPFPLGCRTLTQPTFTFLGPDCEGVGPVKLDALAFRRRLPLSVRYPGERGKAGGSGFVAAAVGEYDEAVEAEPNDAPDQATPVAALPVALNGQLAKPGDRDFYRFPAKKGQRLSLSARTRSLGSPCDVRLQLFKPDGGKLAESKVEGAGEGTLEETAPADGDYRVMVEDINRAGAPGLAYRVVALPYAPRFELTVDTDRVNAKAGETFELKVACPINNSGTPITLSVDGDGLTFEPATIPDGKKEAVLKGKVPAGAKPGAWVPLRVLGTKEVDGGTFRAEASTMPALRRLYPRMLYPPDELDGLIALGVRAPGE